MCDYIGFRRGEREKKQTQHSCIELSAAAPNALLVSRTALLATQTCTGHFLNIGVLYWTLFLALHSNRMLIGWLGKLRERRYSVEYSSVWECDCRCIAGKVFKAITREVSYLQNTEMTNTAVNWLIQPINLEQWPRREQWIVAGRKWS